MRMGNHQTLCTFAMQQIGRWVVICSQADSDLHGHCLAVSWEQCLLWILFMSCCILLQVGPIPVKAECLCPQKAATIFQHTRNIRLRLATPRTTKDMKILVTPA